MIRGFVVRRACTRLGPEGDDAGADQSCGRQVEARCHACTAGHSHACRAAVADMARWSLHALRHACPADQRVQPNGAGAIQQHHSDDSGGGPAAAAWQGFVARVVMAAWRAVLGSLACGDGRLARATARGPLIDVPLCRQNCNACPSAVPCLVPGPQAMAAVLGGTQSLHTNSFDEARPPLHLMSRPPHRSGNTHACVWAVNPA